MVLSLSVNPSLNDFSYFGEKNNLITLVSNAGKIMKKVGHFFFSLIMEFCSTWRVYHKARIGYLPFCTKSGKNSECMYIRYRKKSIIYGFEENSG